MTVITTDRAARVRHNCSEIAEAGPTLVVSALAGEVAKLAETVENLCRVVREQEEYLRSLGFGAEENR